MLTKGEGGARHLRQAPGLPAIAGRGVAGDPGSSRLLPIRPAPQVPQSFSGQSPTNDAQRAGRIGTRSGLDAGGTTPHNARLAVPDATTTTSTSGSPCRAPAARRARGAERERAQAGASGGASGPCRPGLKPYRKSSPTKCQTEVAGNRTESHHQRNARQKWLAEAPGSCAVPADA
jgi:hypothetical protein